MDQLANLRGAYRILEDTARTTIHTQTGDIQQLSSVRDDALVFMASVQMVSPWTRALVIFPDFTGMKHQNLFSAAEHQLIVDNVKAMVQALDEAYGQSLDQLPPPSSSQSYLGHTGNPGRPRVEIDAVILQSLALEPKTTLAEQLGCCTRTVRRRQQELEHQTGTALVPQQSVLSDNELDAIVGDVLKDSPNYGRSMLIGAMTFRGYNIPERRIRESLNRVRGAPGRFFGSRPIHRRSYYVPAANSLWHHDGQHGELAIPFHTSTVAQNCSRSDPLEDCHPWLH